MKAWRIDPTDYGWREDDDFERLVYAETRGQARAKLAAANDMPFTRIAPYRFPAADDLVATVSERLPDKLGLYLDIYEWAECGRCYRRVYNDGETLIAYGDDHREESLAVVGEFGVWCSPECAGTDHEPWRWIEGV